MTSEQAVTSTEDTSETRTLELTENHESDRRLIATYEAALAVASEVSIEAVLQRIVDVARTVAVSQYAALGVARGDGRLLQFITSGISDEDRATIGPIPEGYGLLGELIRDSQPLLVPNIAADHRSSGFPPNHPPMRTFLGVPILIGNRVLGNLYLTDRLDGEPFNEVDLQAVQILASYAASAIDRSSLYGKLTEQRDRLRTILDSLPAGVVILSGNGGAIQLANSAFVRIALGDAYSPGVLPTYDRDFTFHRADGLPLTFDELPGTRALRGEALYNIQITLKRSNGSSLPISVQAAPLTDERSGQTDAVLVVQDVTQLRQAEQLKDDFLSLISHEFRTPLTAIHGGAHLLADAGTSLDPKTRQELLGDVVAESDRLDRMLKNLLTLSSAMGGRLSVETEPVLLAPLAKIVSREVSARSPRHQFELELPEGTPAVEGDPSLIAQVLRNLYENSVKYSPSGGKIRTTAHREDKNILLDVTDEGLGIGAAHLGSVFERFNRANVDPTIRGMGLGLYLSKLLIEAQGGSLSVTSPGPGKGSTFTVSLPVAHDWELTDED